MEIYYIVLSENTDFEINAKISYARTFIISLIHTDNFTK